MRRFLLVLSLLVSARTTAAQLATSYEVGLPGVLNLDALLVGVRVASIKPLVPGVDWEVVVLPAGLPHGVLVLASGLDVTYPLPIGPSLIISPRAGASALGGGGADGFAGVVGYNVGVGLVGRTGAKAAVRVDIGRHWFDEYAVNVVTIGVVTVP